MDTLVSAVVNLRPYKFAVNPRGQLMPAELAERELFAAVKALVRRTDGPGRLYWNHEWDDKAGPNEFTYVRADKSVRLVVTAHVTCGYEKRPIQVEVFVSADDYVRDTQIGRNVLQGAFEERCRRLFGSGVLVHVGGTDFLWQRY